MTALARYELLEAEGRYFDGETAAAVEVIVKFGDSSLMVLDRRETPVTHWPLASLRALKTAGDGLTLIPDHGPNERLTVTDPDMIGAIREVCPDLSRSAPAPRGQRRKVLFWTATALASVYLLIFHIIPALSNQLAELIPPEAEVAMGEDMVDEFAAILTGFKDPEYCSTPSGDAALAAMTGRLARGADSHVPLTVRVLKHEMVNAFALPGGQVVLFSGLIDSADTPEEVAGVLAHEIGHVVARDPTRLTLRSAGSAGLLGVLLGDFTGAGATVLLAEALLTTGYQREAEAEADDFAIALLNRQGLPTAPLAGFFMKVKELGADAPEWLTHLSTHPDLDARAEAARAADSVGEGAFRPVLTDQQWVALQGICG